MSIILFREWCCLPETQGVSVDDHRIIAQIGHPDSRLLAVRGVDFVACAETDQANNRTPQDADKKNDSSSCVRSYW